MSAQQQQQQQRVTAPDLTGEFAQNAGGEKFSISSQSTHLLHTVVPLLTDTLSASKAWRTKDKKTTTVRKDE